mmetsp:Transcript_96253/g.294404  ORF Transcript_96253/g.294404 Transcript_96253/m.294404 type:complete len:218 (+) Transcript_96253:519-1172(+)
MLAANMMSLPVQSCMPGGGLNCLITICDTWGLSFFSFCTALSCNFQCWAKARISCSRSISMSVSSCPCPWPTCAGHCGSCDHWVLSCSPAPSWGCSPCIAKNSAIARSVSVSADAGPWGAPLPPMIPTGSGPPLPPSPKGAARPAPCWFSMPVAQTKNFSLRSVMCGGGANSAIACCCTCGERLRSFAAASGFSWYRSMNAISCDSSAPPQDTGPAP